MIADIRVEAGSVLQARTKLPEYEVKKQPPGAWPGPLVRLRPRDGKDFHEIAYVDAAEAEGMRKSGWRHLSVWADTGRTALVATVETESAHPERAVYRVLDPSGTPLARVTRVQGAVSPPHRTHWTVEPAQGPALRAVKGGVAGWIWWWAFSPVWAVMLLVALLGGDFPRMPLSTTWRRDGTDVLAYTGVLGHDHDYSVVGEWADQRLLVALVALHNTHLAWRDRP